MVVDVFTESTDADVLLLYRWLPEQPYDASATTAERVWFGFRSAFDVDDAREGIFEDIAWVIT